MSLEIYGKNNCSMCITAKAILALKSEEITYINIEEECDQSTVDEILDKAISQGHKSFPLLMEDGAIVCSGMNVLETLKEA